MQAQSISELEYFFDANDPGVGNATGLTIGGVNEEIDQLFNIDLSPVSNGLHSIHFRVKNNDNNWSVTHTRNFIKYEGATINILDRLEYSVDEIVSPGSGTQVSLAPQETVDTLINIALNGVDVGLHTLFVRVQQANGNWSQVYPFSFLKYGDSGAQEINRLVYWFDDEEMPDNPNVLVEGAESIEGNYPIELGGLNLGIHTLFVAAVDAKGSQSIVHQAPVVVYAGDGGVLGLRRLEYFWGDEVGVGNGTAIVLDAETIDTAFTLDVPTVSELSNDPVTIRVQDQMGRWSVNHSYPVENCPVGWPVAGFDHIRAGNIISFIDTSRNGQSYLWDFGDGQTSTVRFPIHQYGIGEYFVSQTISNICETVEHRDTILIEGVSSYTPRRAGVGGDFVFNAFGVGFDENSTVTLSKGETVLEPLWILALDEGKKLKAYFDVHEVEQGLYDIEFTINGVTHFFPNGFRLLPYKAPDLSSSIQAPSLFRTNRWQNIQLEVNNSGNVMAKGVMAFLVVPDDVEIERLFDYYEYPDNSEFVINGETFTYNESEFDVFDNEGFIEIDQLFGEPCECHLYDFYISYIESNSTYTLPFRARSSNAGEFDFIAFNYGTPFYGSPKTVAGSTIVDGLAGSALVSNDASNIGGSVNNIGEAIQATTDALQQGFDGRLDNSNDQNLYMHEQVHQVQTDGNNSNNSTDPGPLPTNFIKESNVTDKVTNDAMEMQQDLQLQDFDHKQTIEALKSIEKGTNALTNAFKNKVENQLLDGNTSLEDLFGSSDVENVDETIQNETPPDLTHLLGDDNLIETPTEVIQAVDPNAIYGPIGPGKFNYIRSVERQSFAIAFENVDTATAPVQEVVVRLPIDTNLYDVSSISLNSIILQEDIYYFDNDRDNDFMTVYLPDENLNVLIQAKWDPLQRSLCWYFTALDPNTGDLPTDPLAGFLHPNINPPEGQGC